MSMHINLQGKAALVTGASSGIGAAIARALGAAGADVALVGRHRERLERVAGEIRGHSARALIIEADIDDDDSPRRIVDEAVAGLGRLDGVLNCAGLFLTGPADESADSFDRQWRTNVRAPFHLTVAALPELRRTRGAVVFLSSIAGRIGFPNSTAYCATKGAVELLTKSLAIEEAGNGVRVNAIAPGNVETPMNAHLMADPAYLKAMIDATPLGRNGRVQDIAPLAVLLVSDHGSYITGESIAVDGGWTAQ